MRKLLSIAVLSALALACTTSKQTTMSTSDNNTGSGDGWQMLFDGKTTNGWHSYGKQTIGSAWKVMDGTLMLDTSKKDGWQTRDGGDIVTAEEFENFHLQFDWKVAPGGNSGVMFYVQEDPSKYPYVWHTGPEMQVLDNERHSDAKIHKHRAGDLYDLIASKEVVKPAGEWNHAEIISNKGKLEFYLNGQQTLSTTLWDDNWRNLVAGSKFKDMPDFGKFQKGHISLQDHGDLVWYRNIKIKRL